MECTAGNSDGESSAKRRRGRPKIKGVVVLLDGDVVRRNDQVYMPNTIELGWLKKKGQYDKITSSSKMTVEDVRSALHWKFPFLKNKRLSCASAVNNRTRLEFHGERKLWNGTLINRHIKGNSALYLLAEDNHESEDLQVLTGVAQESLINPVSMTSCSKQRELIAQTSEQGSSLQQAPVVVAAAAAHPNVPAKVFFSQTTSAKKPPVSARKRKSHSHGHQELPALMAVSEGETTESGIDSLLENESNQDTVQSRAATQRLKELSQMHASSTADQRHLTGTGNTFGAFIANANHEMLQRQREDLTTQPDHTIGSKQGLLVVQKRPNDPIVQTTVDPGLFSKDIERLEGIPQISSTADHYPAPHKGHLTGKGEDLQPLFSSFNHYGGLLMVQRRQNNPIVQTAVDPESLKSVSMTSCSQQRELNDQTLEQGGTLQQVPPVAAAYRKVPNQDFIQGTPSTQKLSVNQRAGKDYSRQQENASFQLPLALSEGETSDSAFDSALENESNHDIDQSRDIHAASPYQWEEDLFNFDFRLLPSPEVADSSPPDLFEIHDSWAYTKTKKNILVILRDPLPKDAISQHLEFEDLGIENLVKKNPYCFSCCARESQNPGEKKVTLVLKFSNGSSLELGSKQFRYIDRDRELAKEQVDRIKTMYPDLCDEHCGSQTSDHFSITNAGSSSLSENTYAWSLKVLTGLLYTAAQVNCFGYVKIIFSTSAGKIVFSNYKDRATLPEDVARANGHTTLADYLQELNTGLSEENSSDTGTETIDWLELKQAVDVEYSLPSTGTVDAQMLKTCQPPSPKSDYDGNDYLADDEMSACSSPSLSEVSDIEHEDHSQNTIGSCEETPCDAAVVRNLESPFSRTIEIVIESSFEKEVNGESNLLMQNSDSFEFSLHLVGNQLEDIPSMKPESSGCEYKQLDSDDVESYSSGDDITEKEYESTVPCRDEVENWETVESEVMSAIKETSARTTGSHNATHHSGLGGDQKELRMTDNAEASGSRDLKLFDALNCLDRNTRSIHNWKHLASKLLVSEDVIEQLEQYRNQSPAVQFFEYLEVTKPQLTIQQLRNAMLNIKRDDLCRLLEIKGGFAGSERVQDVMPAHHNSSSRSLVDETALALDSTTSLVSGNLNLGVPRRVCLNFDRNSTQSPTKELFQYLKATHPEMTLKDLKEILDLMERKDLLYYLTKQDLKDEVSLKDVMSPGSEILQTVADKLDCEMPGVDNWCHLACKLGVPVDICQQLRLLGRKEKSPTKEVMQWLVAQFPDMTLNDVVMALEKIQCYDGIQIISTPFPDTVPLDSKLFDVLKCHPDFLDEFALCLDRNTRLIRNWKHLALELHVDKDVIEKLEQCKNQSPTIQLFEYLEVKKPQLTIQQLRNAMLDIKRNDLCSLLTTKGGFAGSERVQDVMPAQHNSSTPSLLDEISLALDSTSLVSANWYKLALNLGVPRRVCLNFDINSIQSPTKELLQYLKATHPEMTLKDLKEILHLMEWNDLLDYLTNQDLKAGPQHRPVPEQAAAAETTTTHAPCQESSGDDINYKAKSGYVLVINNQIFPKRDLVERTGSSDDVRNLISLFDDFNFRHRVEDNLSGSQMCQVLGDIAEKDFSRYDCFVCVILSHGQKDGIYGTDEEVIKIEAITSFFRRNKCPSLEGKPKIFLIQACRGSQRDRVPVESGSDPVSFSSSSLPADADFLICFASAPGHESYRYREAVGSWFISSVVDVFKKYAEEEHLMDMMLRVNNKVAQFYSKEGLKQMPCQVCMLRKKVFFDPKYGRA